MNLQKLESRAQNRTKEHPKDEQRSKIESMHNIIAGGFLLSDHQPAQSSVASDYAEYSWIITTLGMLHKQQKIDMIQDAQKDQEVPTQGMLRLVATSFNRGLIVPKLNFRAKIWQVSVTLLLYMYLPPVVIFFRNAAGVASA